MNYVSTNRRSPAVSFREAVFSGLAPDGGLYVPEELPQLPAGSLASLPAGSLHEIGSMIVERFIDDIPKETLSAIVADAWTFPIPLVPLESRIHLLELFHGPTLAFKDVGARFLARVLSHYLQESRREITIAVATSGDTGSAVAHGFFGVPRVTVYVLYPSGRISRLQEQQMATLGGNIRTIEVEGSFDDCQRMVKDALADERVRRAVNLTTANSISLGRLIPQIVYYAWAVGQWLGQPHEPRSVLMENLGPAFVVPSGNFGNLTAAAYAQAIGVPIQGLIAATNVNDVVAEYARTGSFVPRPSIATVSNAMDVGDPSNLARLRWLFGDDRGRFCERIAVHPVSDKKTLQEIRRTYETSGKIIDPHTAVGVSAARSLDPSIPAIVMSTAHPGKFPEVVERALGISIPLPPPLEEALRRPKRSVRMEPTPEAFKRMLVT